MGTEGRSDSPGWGQGAERARPGRAGMEEREKQGPGLLLASKCTLGRSLVRCQATLSATRGRHVTVRDHVREQNRLSRGDDVTRVGRCGNVAGMEERERLRREIRLLQGTVGLGLGEAWRPWGGG